MASLGHASSVCNFYAQPFLSFLFAAFFAHSRSGLGLVVRWHKSDVRVCWWLMLDFGLIHTSLISNSALTLFHTILLTLSNSNLQLCFNSISHNSPLLFLTLTGVRANPTVDAHYKPKSCSHHGHRGKNKQTGSASSTLKLRVQILTFPSCCKKVCLSIILISMEMENRWKARVMV